MEPATFSLMLCGIGLVLLMAWTMYRIQQHKKKMHALDMNTIDVGRMDLDRSRSAPSNDEIPPTLPDSELLMVMYRNKKRPWRSAVNSRSSEGNKVMIISTRPPNEIRKLYPGVMKMIWLDRSTAHDLDGDTIVINPTNLSSLLEEIRTFVGGSPGGGTLVFEGFEEVISGNEISRVIRFLNMLKQTCREESVSAVVPLAYRAIPQRVRNQLTEGFESVVIG